MPRVDERVEDAAPTVAQGKADANVEVVAEPASHRCREADRLAVDEEAAVRRRLAGNVLRPGEGGSPRGRRGRESNAPPAPDSATSREGSDAAARGRTRPGSRGDRAEGRGRSASWASAPTPGCRQRQAVRRSGRGRGPAPGSRGREEDKESGSRVAGSDPGGIRTLDLHLERVACWASAPQGRRTDGFRSLARGFRRPGAAGLRPRRTGTRAAGRTRGSRSISIRARTMRPLPSSRKNAARA